MTAVRGRTENEDPAVVLLPGREKAVRNRHHWIFSGAIREFPEFEDGDVLPVRSAAGEFLGSAYFNRRSGIAGRMIAFDPTPPLQALDQALTEAAGLRDRILGRTTDACRIVNGEGDGIPGLIVDRYGDVLVLQISTLGMDRLKPRVLEILSRIFTPRTILEKSHLPSRKEEGMLPFEGRLRGDPVENVEILENGLRFRVDLAASQKTGFYLDQRENRSWVRTLAAGRKVLDAFCYTGGFSAAALAGGAASAHSLDASRHAVEAARLNVALNGFEAPPDRFIVADAFDYFRARSLDFDFVILDPPAFAKRKGEVLAACRGYKDIHRLVFGNVPRGALVLTFSCSYFVDEKLFRQVLFQAAAEARRRVRILGRHRPSPDHPVNVFHPEGDYLKGFLLDIE